MPILKKMLNLNTIEGILTGKETLSITFLKAELTKKRDFVKDFTRNVDVFKKDSFEDLNGMSYANVPALLDIDWHIGRLDKQNKGAST